MADAVSYGNHEEIMSRLKQVQHQLRREATTTVQPSTRMQSSNTQ